MTITSFPFDNQDSTEGQFSQLFRELQDTGIVDAPGGTGFKVTPHASQMSLLLSPGVAIVRGHMVVSTAEETIPLTPAGASTRFDTVVLRLDPTANGITPVVREGAYGGGAPTLTQTDTDVYELPLATAEVNTGVGVIAPAKCVDQRRFTGQRTGAWSTALRPSSPRAYKLGFNTTTGQWEYHTGSGWANVVPGQVADSLRWNGYTLTVSTTTPGGTPTTDRIWIQPTS